MAATEPARRAHHGEGRRRRCPWRLLLTLLKMIIYSGVKVAAMVCLAAAASIITRGLSTKGGRDPDRSRAGP
jgi:hypothetical protein